MIISISGKPGSGKSTVAKKLARALGYKHYYVGSLRRVAAKSKGMTLAEFNQWSEKNQVGDKEFDDYVTKLGREGDDLVIESRTAFHFIPRSIKIFLDVDETEGADRIWRSLKKTEGAGRNEASQLKSLADVKKSIQNRIKSDDYRYKKYYNLDVFDKRHYDYYLDTTNLNPEEKYNQVYFFVIKKLKKE